MFNRFDDLFNDFFNRKKMVSNPLHDEIKKLIETVANFKKIQNDAKLEQEIDKELGKPSQIEEIVEDGLLYKKLTWFTPYGHFVKIVVSDAEEANHEPKKPTRRVKEKSLEEQLKEAVEAENYELAIQLRDQIKSASKPKKTKKEKKS